MLARNSSISCDHPNDTFLLLCDSVCSTFGYTQKSCRHCDTPYMKWGLKRFIKPHYCPARLPQLCADLPVQLNPFILDTNLHATRRIAFFYKWKVRTVPRNHALQKSRYVDTFWPQLHCECCEWLGEENTTFCEYKEQNFSPGYSKCNFLALRFGNLTSNVDKCFVAWQALKRFTLFSWKTLCSKFPKLSIIPQCLNAIHFENYVHGVLLNLCSSWRILIQR